LRIAITGARSAIARKIAEIAGIERHDVTLAPPRERLDLLGPADPIERWLTGGEPDVVIHLAGSKPPAPAHELFANNIGATYALIRAMDRAAPHAGLVMASSAAVYGEGTAGIAIGAESDCRPINAYGASKFAQEAIATTGAQRSGRRLAILRIFNVVGVDGERSSVLPATVERMLSIEPGARFSVRNGSCVRDFIDVRDVAGAFLTASLNARISGVFNACTGIGVSVQDLTAKVARHIGKPAILENCDAYDDQTIRWSVGDPANLESFGWTPQVSLDDSISSVIKAAKTRPS
jgi:nucleoside-diphosphate-sugar epimerase